MIQRRFRLLTLFSIVLFGLTVNAFADCREKVDLLVGPGGFGLDVSGHAEVRSRDNDERIKVSMDARVADGTTFIVTVDGAVAGTITIRLGDGELELDNHNGKTLPAGVSPVCGLRNIRVLNNRGDVVLEGNF